jgi:hypothetical protein
LSTAKSIPIGTTSCVACGAKVTVRYSTGRDCAFWTCNAQLDAKACGSRLVLGPRPSRELRAQVQAPSATAPAEPGAVAPAPPRSPGPWAALGIDFSYRADRQGS